jgi:hypothetical protein
MTTNQERLLYFVGLATGFLIWPVAVCLSFLAANLGYL